jgi:hypothetical protein
MAPSAALLALAGLSALNATIARHGVRALEDDAATLARLPWGALFLVSAVSSGLALAFLPPGGAALPVVPALVGQLMLAGWIDRQTTWVPDGVLAMVLLIGSFHVLGDVGLPVPVARLAAEWGESGRHVALALSGLCISALVWLGTMLFWQIQLWLNRVVLTPPDQIALLLPAALLGVGLTAAIAYAMIAAVALACLASPTLRRMVSHERAVEEGRRDLGLTAERPAVALLPIAFTVLSIALCLEWRMESFFAYIAF